jgi:hypothetical protein
MSFKGMYTMPPSPGWAPGYVMGGSAEAVADALLVLVVAAPVCVEAFAAERAAALPSMVFAAPNFAAVVLLSVEFSFSKPAVFPLKALAAPTPAIEALAADPEFAPAALAPEFAPVPKPAVVLGFAPAPTPAVVLGFAPVSLVPTLTAAPGFVPVAALDPEFAPAPKLAPGAPIPTPAVALDPEFTPALAVAPGFVPAVPAPTPAAIAASAAAAPAPASAPGFAPAAALAAPGFVGTEKTGTPCPVGLSKKADRPLSPMPSLDCSFTIIVSCFLLVLRCGDKAAKNALISRGPFYFDMRVPG